ncbi:MAG: hypothetical protein KIT11_03425 [Fimbriimonadaceae bacterium]|nr:hypothetical protein [Fimbriimonadaceae bacterium]QYK57052.1 MAG: hypothetical protein KF733_06100 [Fimbriimonadaceae bacterium]
MTYNGLLASYSATSVASPGRLPLVWVGQGKANIDGGMLTNPALRCPQRNTACQYIPYQTGCSSARNGEQSAMFVLSGPVWVYGKGANFAFVDGHARFTNLGMTLSPNNTDWRVDPYTGYDKSGYPGFYWWDGCHAWLFRPDYDSGQ